MLRILVPLLLSPVLLAQTLTITATSDRRRVLSGERFVPAIEVRNSGPVAASDVAVNMGFITGGLFFAPSVPPGWTCDNMPVSNFLRCSTPSLAPGATARISATAVIVLFTPGNRFSATARASWVDAGGAPRTTPSANIPIEVTPSSARTDLSVTSEGPSHVREGEPAFIRFDVHNTGPAEAGPVYVSLTGNAHVAVPLEADGWACVAKSRSYLCVRDSIAAQTTAPLTVRFDTPDAPAQLTAHAHVVAERVQEATSANNSRSHTVHAGNPENYERILLPMTNVDQPGTFGSRWRTEVSAIIDSESDVPATIPVHCSTGGGGFIDGPVPPPVRKPFDPFHESLICRTEAGSFAAVRKEDADKIHFHIRVRDLTRNSQGTEIPVVRERELRTERVTLLSVPVDPAYRHTLRIYDADVRPEGQAIIRIWATGEDEPRVTTTRAFREPPRFHVTPALLPAVPATIQLDPIAEFASALAGADEVWIEIEPASPGLRIWAFATITNNATGEVTTVTPQ